MTNDIIATIRGRRSVRTFAPEPLRAEDRAYVEALAAAVSNPFGEAVGLHLAEAGAGLSTYGVVRDAPLYVGATAAAEGAGPLALGYAVEALVLGLAARGLGSVWLGGTFKRAGFAAAMGLDAEAWLPVVLPVGYAAKRPATAEKLLRRMTKADERLAWRDLFTEDGFQVQLTEEAAGAYALPLEMLRLAPSASNEQPWRVVMVGDRFHFYETHKASLGQAQVLLKAIDLGIGIAHFHLTAQALGLRGRFVQAPLGGVRIPEDTFYHISWQAEEA